MEDIRPPQMCLVDSLNGMHVNYLGTYTYVRSPVDGLNLIINTFLQMLSGQILRLTVCVPLAVGNIDVIWAPDNTHGWFKDLLKYCY